jgi:hypothetical protein
MRNPPGGSGLFALMCNRGFERYGDFSPTTKVCVQSG